MKAKILTLLLLSCLVVLVSCTGEEGPAGIDGSSIDAIPPTVVLDYPTAGEKIGNSFTAAVSAVDNVGIDKVHFLLDGSDRINDTTYAVVFESPYTYTFDFDLLNVENGTHTFQAKAYDLQGNFASTSPVLFDIDFIPLTGPGFMRHWTADSLNALSIPDRSEENSEISYFIRFEVERDCVLDSVRIYLDSLAQETMNYDRDLTVEIFNSNGIYPTELFSSNATATLASTDLPNTGFHTAAFSVQDTLLAENRYHVVFRCEETPSDTTRMAVGTSIRDLYPYDTDNNSGIGFSTDGQTTQWQTYQEFSNNTETSLEFMVELWVNYLE